MFAPDSYDSTLYLGTATHYTRGRPHYSQELASTLATEAHVDGTSRLLDVGCGPGVLSRILAPYCKEVIALDPDAEMIAEGQRSAADASISNIRWVQARAEEVASLHLGTFRLVTFGQSFHWVDREKVAADVYELLEPGGKIALITHGSEGRPVPPNPGHPPIPHDAIRAIIHRYLGTRRRGGQGFVNMPTDPHEEVLARSRFTNLRTLYCPGRPDLLQNVDAVMSNYFSMSFAAPHLFGDQLANFENDVRAELASHSPSGLFWDWPGDTAILLAEKPL